MSETMTFEQMPYERVDFAALTRDYEQMTRQMKEAKSPAEAEALLRRHTEIHMPASTMMNLSSIRHTINTEDPFYLAEEEFYAENCPAFEQTLTDFYRAVLASPFRSQLEQVFPKVFFTNAEIDAKTISPEVLADLEQENKLVMEYQKLQGGARIQFQGQTLNLSQLGVYKESPDRQTRRAAYQAESDFYTAHKKEYDEVYDKLVKVRTTIAKKLGFKNFVELGYLRMTRNCYDAQDAAVFRQEVVKEIVPRVIEMKKAQAKRLGLEDFKFYDDPVSRNGGNPKPQGSFDDTYRSGVEMYREMNEQTRGFIDKMDRMHLFDLIAKEGKMTGGYCTYLADYKAPFIFANFNGTSHDVEVFTHEGGHAFAGYLASETAQLRECASPTLEGCEVHSMSMEFLCWPWLQKFYGDQTDCAKADHLSGTLYFLPYGCQVDEFQHIVYENPDLTPDQRNEKWAELDKKYRPWLDFDGVPFYSSGASWQRQLHIYTSPFYYIDYCLAQSVALQIFELMQDQSWQAAWEKYMAYTRQGGSDTFLGLLEKAGLQNPMKPGALQKAAQAAADYMARHQEDLN